MKASSASKTRGSGGGAAAAASSSGGDEQHGLVRTVGDGSSAIKSLADALNQERFSDVTFAVGPKEFHAHRCILAARSEVFYTMLFGGMREAHERRVVVENVDPDNFYVVLQWAYTGQASMTAREVLGVLHLASFYGFPDLEDHCRRLASGFIDTLNVVSLLDAAIEIDEDAIVTQALDFIRRNTSATIAQPSWLTLRKAGVEEVLKQPSLNCSECQLFDRTLDWIQHNCEGDEENERSLLATFLPHIRFPQMTTADLLGKVKPLVARTRVHQNEYVEALEFKLLPAHHAGRDEDRFRVRVPSAHGTIVLNVPFAMLDGWTRVVEVDHRIHLPEEAFASLASCGATYVCVGERVRNSPTISVAAFGTLDVATRRGTNHVQCFPDGEFFWWNHAVTNTFGFSPTPDSRMTHDVTQSDRDRKLSWQIIRSAAPPPAMQVAAAAAAGGAGGAAGGSAPGTPAGSAMPQMLPQQFLAQQQQQFDAMYSQPNAKLRFIYVK